ncbi:MAG TPA: DUF4395 domain-containing protein [Candidatus Nanopelagicaceae bacterium]|nr:DUF4395 domain-containing protein [Candidatus Nanopelagicaceae bacterium]
MSTSNLIDARGPRFAAGFTTSVLSIAFLTQSLWLLLVQTFVFAVGAKFGPSRTPYGFFFRKFIKPRLTPASRFEDIKPTQFAQSVGLAFGVLALAGDLLGIQGLYVLALAGALAAAFLNVAFDYCLGCETYLLFKRLQHRSERPKALTSELASE